MLKKECVHFNKVQGKGGRQPTSGATAEDGGVPLRLWKEEPENLWILGRLLEGGASLQMAYCILQLQQPSSYWLMAKGPA